MSGMVGRAPAAPDSSTRQPFSLSLYSGYNRPRGAGASTGTTGVAPRHGCKISPPVLPMKLELFCLVLFKSAALKKKLIIMGGGEGVGKGGVRPGMVGGPVRRRSLGWILSLGRCLSEGLQVSAGVLPTPGSCQHPSSFLCYRQCRLGRGRCSPAPLPCVSLSC